MKDKLHRPETGDAILIIGGYQKPECVSVQTCFRPIHRNTLNIEYLCAGKMN